MEFGTNILNIVALMCNAFTKVLDILTTPFGKLIGQVPTIPIIGNIIDYIVNDTFFGDLTLLSVMIGQLLIVYVVYQFAIWIFNIVT